MSRTLAYFKPLLVPKTLTTDSVPVSEPDYLSGLLKLPIVEVPIFGNPSVPNTAQSDLNSVAKVSRAVYPPKEPYFVAETDGPKHLYILRLDCEAEDWCEEDKKISEGTSIIKVGFSKSPHSRIRQIQAAYPLGRYKWKIVYPNPVDTLAPYANAQVAIAGEDAMKKFLAEDSDRLLGGEFFLATEVQLKHAWSIGKSTANKASIE